MLKNKRLKQMLSLCLVSTMLMSIPVEGMAKSSGRGSSRGSRSGSSSGSRSGSGSSSGRQTSPSRGSGSSKPSKPTPSKPPSQPPSRNSGKSGSGSGSGKTGGNVGNSGPFIPRGGSGGGSSSSSGGSGSGGSGNTTHPDTAHPDNSPLKNSSSSPRPSTPSTTPNDEIRTIENNLKSSENNRTFASEISRQKSDTNEWQKYNAETRKTAELFESIMTKNSSDWNSEEIEFAKKINSTHGAIQSGNAIKQKLLEARNNIRQNQQGSEVTTNSGDSVSQCSCKVNQ